VRQPGRSGHIVAIWTSGTGSAMQSATANRAPLRVLVADDHELMRSALRLLLTPADGLHVVGEAATGAQVAPLVAATNPDVVVLDLRMPGLDGLQCVEQLAASHPQVTVVVLSAVDDRETIEAALRRGAASYILKTIDPLDLAPSIRQSVEGCVFQPGALLADGPPRAVQAAGLSEKEAQVLVELSKGRSNREIAETLWLSEQTIKFHLRNVYRKLGVANRTEAMRLALERHLVDAA
jgi:DNA-binding NarL/FixJ family response regulator